MKLAVTYDNGEVFQHFGHTEYFKIYTIEDGSITSEEVLSTNGQGHGALAGFLQEHEVNAHLRRDRGRCKDCSCCCRH